MVVRNKLPRSLTLKSRAQIDRLFKDSRRLSGDSFTLLWQLSDRFQYGIFVKKQLGPANLRNRVKRLFHEAIRLNRNLLEQGFIVAVLPRVTVTEWDFKSINAEIGRAFKLVQKRAK